MSYKTERRELGKQYFDDGEGFLYAELKLKLKHGIFPDKDNWNAAISMSRKLTNRMLTTSKPTF